MKSCQFCHNEIPLAWSFCPHCARPNIFPNIEAASDPAESLALEERYQASVREVASRGVGEIGNQFIAALQASQAVIARPAREADRLAASDRQIYPTYYKLLKAQLIYPDDNDKWHRLRLLADDFLFPSYKEEIRYAALSLDGRGLSRYGGCFLVMRGDMISYRASLFEGNSAAILESLAYRLPLGYRAPWQERAKLCAAKLGGEINGSTGEIDFPFLLMHESTDGDCFLEVHIWGPITRRTLERVIVCEECDELVFIEALKERLAGIGVPVEEC
jgi:hypothetical protein